MLHLMVALSLVGAYSTPQAAAAEAPVLKAELKDVAAQEKEGPALLCEGSTNLPDGALVDIFLYYDYIVPGKEIAKGVATGKAGKFTQDFQPFPKSKANLPGKYIAILKYNPALQNQNIAGFVDHKVEISLQLGAPQDFEREAKAFRGRLVGEVQALVALGEDVKAKIKELKGKPADAWAPLLNDWSVKAVEIQKRADPRNVPEYNILKIDLVATSGLENLTGILNSAARYAAAGKSDDAIEGLTRLRQTAEFWMSEMNAPKLTEIRQIVQLIDAARKLIGEALTQPDSPVLPARRKFLEMNSILQKSLPEELQPAVLEIGTRSAAFFSALSDKEPNVKDLHAELDKTLEKLAALFRATK